MVGSSIADDTFRSGYIWQCPKFLRECLLEAGWCVGELPTLISKCPPTILLYLCSIRRQLSDKNHYQCTENVGCLANQLNLATYKTSHAFDCQENHCDMVEVPIQDVCKALTAGGIPTANLVMAEDTGKPELEVRAFMLNSEKQEGNYVAISHVWSDGMGNPRRNALMSCQLHRIQRSVNQLYPSRLLTAGNQPFWMDTLCVPLNPEMRILAITRMAKTYLHAGKVLVLDNWLNHHAGEMDPGNILVRIAHSDWSTRLWTFQEAILANECHFQFERKAFVIDDLKDSCKISANLEEISQILSQVPKTELLQTESMLNLLRALTSVDSYALDRIQTWATLPPQIDQDTEELRLHAIQSLQRVVHQRRLHEKWFPILAQAESISKNPNNDEAFRTHIEANVFEPVYSYGLEALLRLRGMFFEATVSRSQDLAGGANQQLTAFKDFSPSTILVDVCRGLRGRMTSRLEDETICLGGIIGLDVSPLLKVRIDEHRKTQDVEAACVARMKIFLSMVNKLPSSILFWEADRIKDKAWKWAPLSFLDKRACVAMIGSDMAECTPDGLLGSYNSIRVTMSRASAIERRFRTLRLQYTDPETASAGIFPYRRSWECLEMRPSTASPKPDYSWCDCFSECHKDVAIILFGQRGLEGILVSVSETAKDVIYAEYLSNIHRVTGDDEPEYFGSYVNAEWMSMRAWCIG